MELKKTFSRKRTIFLLLFLVMVLIGKKINFSPVIGAENQYFTLFQFFGPITGSFLGPVFGAVSVLGAEVADFLITGKALNPINLVRLTPMLFAAYYFGTRKRNRVSIAVPLIAMVLFVLHPVGREVWFFALYWTIPIIVKLLPKGYSNNLVLRSLGATFTAHSVGTAAWIWVVPMTAEQWIMLIPIVAFERLMFTAGIVVSYVMVDTALDRLFNGFKWKIPSEVLFVDKRYVLSKRLFGILT